VAVARERRTLLNRLQRNTVRVFTAPFQKRSLPEFREEDVEDLMEFAGLRREQVVEYLQRSSGLRHSDELDWLRPASAEEYGWFYRGSRTYLFCVGMRGSGPSRRFSPVGGRSTSAAAADGIRSRSPPGARTPTTSTSASRTPPS
jgi:hypothetical protein